MSSKKRILLKITGTLFDRLTSSLARTLAVQLKELAPAYHIGIVLGGGNIFRGATDADTATISQKTGHQIGMIATMINGLIMQEALNDAGLSSQLLCALSCPSIGQTISQQTIDQAIKDNRILIFTGGTGAPYVTTDTNAVVRALQIGADELWKCTNVDGVYTADPKTSPDALRLDTLSYTQAIQEDLGVMDMTALILAQKHNVPIRVFNIFSTDSLINAANNNKYGSRITNEQE